MFASRSCRWESLATAATTLSRKVVQGTWSAATCRCPCGCDETRGTSRRRSWHSRAQALRETPRGGCGACFKLGARIAFRILKKIQTTLRRKNKYIYSFACVCWYIYSYTYGPTQPSPMAEVQDRRFCIHTSPDRCSDGLRNPGGAGARGAGLTCTLFGPQSPPQDRARPKTRPAQVCMHNRWSHVKFAQGPIRGL